MNSRVEPVLVLVHAFPMGAAMWEPQRAAAPGWRIVTPSLAGFDGRPLLADNTMPAYARDLLDVLDQQGIARAVFGGLSLGGYVLFELLRQAPQRVAGLILADTRTRSTRPSDWRRAGGALSAHAPAGRLQLPTKCCPASWARRRTRNDRRSSHGCDN